MDLGAEIDSTLCNRVALAAARNVLVMARGLARNEAQRIQSVRAKSWDHGRNVPDGLEQVPVQTTRKKNGKKRRGEGTFTIASEKPALFFPVAASRITEGKTTSYGATRGMRGGQDMTVGNDTPP